MAGHTPAEHTGQPGGARPAFPSYARSRPADLVRPGVLAAV